MPPKLTDMTTWTGRTGHDKLRSFKADDGSFWLEQNPTKRSKWSVLASKGHDIAWEFGTNRLYTGRIMIDSEILSVSAATTKFLKTSAKGS
jgi:hypothetical protein